MIALAILFGVLGGLLSWRANSPNGQFIVGIALTLVALGLALAGAWSFWLATLGLM